MDRVAFLNKMLEKGKIDKTRYDKAIGKVQKQKTAKEDYKTNKSKLTKAELIAILDELV